MKIGRAECELRGLLRGKLLQGRGLGWIGGRQEPCAADLQAIPLANGRMVLPKEVAAQSIRWTLKVGEIASPDADQNGDLMSARATGASHNRP